MKNYVYAQTPSKNDSDWLKKITAKQWQVYYYLLSISFYNSIAKEDHRYVYKTDFNVSAASKFLGISRPTVYKALENLMRAGLVIDREKVYLLYVSHFVSIEKNTLKNLLGLSKAASKNIDLLRLYLCLKRLNEIASTKEERTFKKRDMVSLLGHNVTDSSVYDDVRNYIALLVYFELIEIDAYTKTQEGLGKCVVYQLKNVFAISNKIDFTETDFAAELKDDTMPKHIYDQIVFSKPELFN